MPQWTVDDQEKFTFDDAEITDLRVRIVDGAVNVVPTDGPARLEITEVTGPPLVVTQEGNRLTVTYEDLRWQNLLQWLDRSSWKRRAVVSVAVPRRTRAQVGVVAGDAMVSGLHGAVAVNGVSGGLTIAQLPGPVETHTVSGQVTAQSVTGDLKVDSVSGELTVVEAGGSVRASTVSGSITVDVAAAAHADGQTRIDLNSVSGEILVRLPQPADANVDASSTGGAVSSAFDELQVHGGFGAKHLTGRLGRGAGRLRANSVSGSITLLKRPRQDDADGDSFEGKVL